MGNLGINSNHMIPRYSFWNFMTLFLMRLSVFASFLFYVFICYFYSLRTSYISAMLISFLSLLLIPFCSPFYSTPFEINDQQIQQQ